MYRHRQLCLQEIVPVPPLDDMAAFPDLYSGFSKQLSVGSHILCCIILSICLDSAKTLLVSDGTTQVASRITGARVSLHSAIGRRAPADVLVVGVHATVPIGLRTLSLSATSYARRSTYTPKPVSTAEQRNKISSKVGLDVLMFRDSTDIIGSVLCRSLATKNVMYTGRLWSPILELQGHSGYTLMEWLITPMRSYLASTFCESDPNLQETYLNSVRLDATWLSKTTLNLVYIMMKISEGVIREAVQLRPVHFITIALPRPGPRRRVHAQLSLQMASASLDERSTRPLYPSPATMTALCLLDGPLTVYVTRAHKVRVPCPCLQTGNPYTTRIATHAAEGPLAVTSDTQFISYILFVYTVNIARITDNVTEMYSKYTETQSILMYNLAEPAYESLEWPTVCWDQLEGSRTVPAAVSVMPSKMADND
ncbi:hypothetical protein PR048_009657 [Dryococelus australis]|uniref:Uncharacterized protein n=1 Tax=Dryococelus australis TaxID=614101 RepID=A0ABQ9I0H3_9NEOP|nr:hypothetical protein PR048_009657 [Dryococelus australis]